MELLWEVISTHLGPLFCSYHESMAETIEKYYFKNTTLMPRSTENEHIFNPSVYLIPLTARLEHSIWFLH